MAPTNLRLNGFTCMFSGRGFIGKIRDTFGDNYIEDLWTLYFTLSTDMAASTYKWWVAVLGRLWTISFLKLWCRLEGTTVNTTTFCKIPNLIPSIAYKTKRDSFDRPILSWNFANFGLLLFTECNALLTWKNLRIEIGRYQKDCLQVELRFN